MTIYTDTGMTAVMYDIRQATATDYLYYYEQKTATFHTFLGGLSLHL
jgi:hypothetical protein